MPGFIMPPRPTATEPPAPKEPQPGPAHSANNAQEPPNDYEAQQQAIVSDNTLDSWEKKEKLKSLDIAFGKNAPAQNPVDTNSAAKIKAITDQINDLDKQINYASQHASMDGMLANLQAQRKALIDQLGPGAQVYDYAYGGVDPTKIVDIKLNNKNIGNARYSGGVATCDIEDVVAGFGGRVGNWQDDEAFIYDSNGAPVSKIVIAGDVAYEKDMNGYIINRYAVEDGHVQMDIAKTADRMGVPYSYYHDKNGVYHAYAQKDMKDAPVQVVRREGDVYIVANIEEPQ
jgi:hypothetical protein